MGLITTKVMLKKAQQGGYAIGAFNVENAEMVKAVCCAAKEEGKPVILQTTPSTLKYLDPAYYYGMVKAAVGEYGIDAALHLDHGNSYELVCKCIDSGYTSVMIDGSKLSFEENIALTQKVIEYAHERGVFVEAELGTVGGKEDETENSASQYTDPQMAKEFVERTGVDSLAIAFGTAHGVYHTKPVLDLNRIALIRETIDTPLVMHGSSGIEEADVRTAIKNGICKVNFATELRAAFSDGVGKYLEEDKEVIDPKKYLYVAQKNVIEITKIRIAQLG